MKELQRTISFRASNTILASGNGKGTKNLMNRAHELYFGKCNDDDSVGYRVCKSSSIKYIYRFVNTSFVDEFMTNSEH